MLFLISQITLTLNIPSQHWLKDSENIHQETFGIIS